MKFKLVSLNQRGPISQLQTLLDARMYNSAINLAEQLIDNDCTLITEDDYVAIQRESGLHNFDKKQNFDYALATFTEWRYPLHNLISLFSELYPKKYIDDLLKMLSIRRK
jgi:hypothetical protein